jgi:iron complex outermembrane recepter protein
MKIKLIVCSVLICFTSISHAQNTAKDTGNVVELEEVIVTAGRIPLALLKNTGAASIVTLHELKSMPRFAAVDEALRLVPGVRIDNQANGSRVHMSVRGQGILSERGLRGIKVLIDGIPVNDPTGFAADLYDVDWPAVSTIEVLRGPSASLYGGSSNAGILNITTATGSDKKLETKAMLHAGSNGYRKDFLQLSGTVDEVSYRLSGSGIRGDGYRYHSAFQGNNISEKISWHPSERIEITQLFIASRYINQNAEGLNLSQLDNPMIANPDAIPCNEYQKTQRITEGLRALFRINENQELSLTTFLRLTDYKEPGSSAVQYRHFRAPGTSLQYSLNLGIKMIKNHFSIGADYQYQQIEESKVPNIKDTARTEETGKIDEKVIEGNTLLANQTILQSSLGIFLVDRLEIGERFNAVLSVRYDNLKNELIDKMDNSVDLSGNADFQKTTARLGVSYCISQALNVYADWGQGFLPPATEELANNPASFGGFNTGLVPAISTGEEMGIRGSIAHSFFYDLTAFIMHTENDFYRYRILPERPLETFYGNAGKTKRTGLETSVLWIPLSRMTIQAAYTFSDYRYTETSSDSMYTNGDMLPAIISGNVLPNAPAHQLCAEAGYTFGKHLTVALSTELQSKWYIYSNLNVNQDGFNLYHARISYTFQAGPVKVDISVYGRNLLNQTYMGFTEPDPDGNSYQPAPGREFFGGLRIEF